MTVHMSTDDVILLEGACPSEDAETLLQCLSLHPAARIDWRPCESAHTAVIQVLMAARPRLLGPPAGQVLQEWVAPALARLSA